MMGTMILTPTDLEALADIFDAKFEERFASLRQLIDNLDYKIDDLYERLADKISDEVHGVRVVVERIERVQIAEVGRLDKQGLQVESLNRTLGLL